MQGMEPVAVATMLILFQYFFLCLQVGRARMKSGIDAPAISGDDQLERAFRVHQNTLEQLMIFLPSLWLFGYYINAQIAAAAAVVFIVSRQLYASDYMKDPKKRARGFIVGQLATIVLVLGALIGATLSWFG